MTPCKPVGPGRMLLSSSYYPWLLPALLVPQPTLPLCRAVHTHTNDVQLLACPLRCCYTPTCDHRVNTPAGGSRRRPGQSTRPSCPPSCRATRRVQQGTTGTSCSGPALAQWGPQASRSEAERERGGRACGGGCCGVTFNGRVWVVRCMHALVCGRAAAGCDIRCDTQLWELRDAPRDGHVWGGLRGCF